MRPNILMLFPDQWRGDWIDAIGDLPLRTPNLDALIKGRLVRPGLDAEPALRTGAILLCNRQGLWPGAGGQQRHGQFAGHADFLCPVA